MKNRRKDPQTIVVDGKLYVFGGLYGYEPIPEDRSSGRGWMEVYDPILETWESLPNPPCSDIRSKFDEIVYAHLVLEEDKHEIMVVDLSNSKVNNMRADFLKYNVVSSRWETWLQQQWAVIDSDIQCGRVVVVDHTKAYWASIESMEKRNVCSIFGFDLKSNCGLVNGSTLHHFWGILNISVGLVLVFSTYPITNFAFC
ncbi:kelch repeat-containing protein At1g19460-like [Castanea sativa]|uniref:kelch repeat-containing protein At1g19460-like n=1 Tax=Castanea sativa TaxID=21020 RepID=UPI003F64DF08